MNDEFALPGDDEAQDLNQVAATGDLTDIDEVEFILETAEPTSRPPGPGLPEALGWTLLMLIVTLGASIMWIVLFAGVLVVQGHDINDMGSDTWIESLPVNSRIMLLLPSSLLAALVLIPLGLLRLGRRKLEKLNLSLPSWTQLVIVLAAVYPTTIISSSLYALTDEPWTLLCEGTWLEAFNENSSVMKVVEYLENGSIVLLLLFLAVVPAVGEEFVFRGIIGRGLTARWGLWWGVLITSCLFALVHLYPPHILAVLPIGIMMHIVYLATRSIWMPVLFHFTNNAMAATFVGLGVVTDEEIVWWMPLAAMAFLAVAIALLYKYRTRYVNDDHQEVGPGYLTVEEPPPEAGARRFAPTGWVIAPLMALVLVGTALYVGLDVADSLDSPPEAIEENAISNGIRPELRPSPTDSAGLHRVDVHRDIFGLQYSCGDCRIKA